MSAKRLIDPLYMMVVMTNFMNLSFILMVTNLSTKIGLVFIVPSGTSSIENIEELNSFPEPRNREAK